MPKRSYRRGYPVAVLIGVSENVAVLWRVFSNVVKPHGTIKLAGKRSDNKALYGFHEAIVDSLRSIIKEGVKSFVVVAPMKTDFASSFMDHAKKHHPWLTQSKGPNSATFGLLVGCACEHHEVAELVKTRAFSDLINRTKEADADRVVDILEQMMNNEKMRVSYSLDEVEEAICNYMRQKEVQPEYLVLTNEYLQRSRERNRVNRVLQIANNRKIKTTIVDADTPAGRRLTQLGGLVCLSRPA